VDLTGRSADPKTSAAWARLERLGREGRQQMHPGQPNPHSIRRWSRYLGPIVRLAFRPVMEHVEHLPPKGAYLLVANHSGLGNPDIACLIVSFLDQPGMRFPAAMVHPVSFNSWPAGVWMERIGAIPSTYEAALSALSQGIPVLVFPGGDIDATRPVWQARRVDFGGRQGFLKIARIANVPIVPMGIRGSHYTTPILFRSKILSTLLVFPHRNGVHRFPVTLLGVLGAAALIAIGPFIGWLLAPILAMAWIALPVAQIPWIPWSVRIRFGKPIEHEELFSDGDDNTLQHAYDRVLGAVEDLVNLRVADRTPPA
jgi:1-acyl-sn-glycerol-3-phosphate acyltransferase